MATKSAIVESKEKLMCGMCQKPYNKPKLLKCFHVFCEQCVQSIVGGEPQGESLVCPDCHQDMALPVRGVQGLPDAINISYCFEKQAILQKLISGEKIICDECGKYEAVGFCTTCGFVCQRNMSEVHQELKKYSTHNVVDFETLVGDLNSFYPLKKTPHCLNHSEKEADLYCKWCCNFRCQECVSFSCKYCGHQLSMVSMSLSKHKEVVFNSLELVKKQRDRLVEATNFLDAQNAMVIKQANDVKAEIRNVMAKHRCDLETREDQLIRQAEQEEKIQLEALAKQRSEIAPQLGNLTRCHEFVEESHHVGSQGEILKVADPLVKHMDTLTKSYVEPQIQPPTKQVSLRFTHDPQDIKVIPALGKVYHPEVLPEKCQASGEGIKVAMRGKVATLSVEALDSEGKAYIAPLESLTCELVSTDGNNCVRGRVEKINQNVYDIYYHPNIIGKHQLHVLIEECHISNSPFCVMVLPDLTAPKKVIRDLKWPWGVAVQETGEVVVAENAEHRVSIVNTDGSRSSFSSCGDASGQLHYPEGLAIDGKGNFLVVEYNNHRVQQFSSTGEPLKTVGEKGTEPLQFYNPVGIVAHPHTHKIYVADNRNSRVQILNPDLSFHKSFGSQGSNDGEFDRPYDISVDCDGKIYVADYRNNRIQVFTADGQYMRQFGRGGKGKGQLELPSGIAIDSRNNMVYVCEHKCQRVSIFSTDGGFIKSFGSTEDCHADFNDAYAVTVDKSGTLYISDRDNNCVLIFD